VTAHEPSCEHASSTHFQTKVIDNKGRNGGYFYFLRYGDARVALGAVRCAACMNSGSL
jgi:hypothetical protein